MRPPPAPATMQHRELYFFALFRVLEAGILGIVAFTPLGATMASIREPALLQVATMGYFLVALFFLYTSRRLDYGLRRQAAVGLVFDIAMWGAALLVMDGGESGLAMFMVFNLGAAALMATAGAVTIGTAQSVEPTGDCAVA